MANYSMGQGHDLAKSDTENDAFNWVMLTTTIGSIVVNDEGGNTVTMSSVPIGVWMPVGNATNIRLESTGDGFIVV